jgi:3-demethoxyubiquinol 3-hydroxylase
MNKRSYSLLDQCLIQLERGLSTVCTILPGRRPNPAADLAEPLLTSAERRASSELMRVNHTGEVCAQALYYGQMAMARSPVIRQALEHAAAEETDHLAWTAQRLQELSSHRSYLNFFWYSQAYLLGLIAGLTGDRWSLGFIEETEQQVTRHLDGHLSRLPANDDKSRKIVTQMRADEQRHAQAAAKAGGAPLPAIIKFLMTLQAKVMTLTAAKV